MRKETLETAHRIYSLRQLEAQQRHEAITVSSLSTTKKKKKSSDAKAIPKA